MIRPIGICIECTGLAWWYGKGGKKPVPRGIAQNDHRSDIRTRDHFIVKLVFGGLFLALTLPHIIHYAMASVLEGRGYSVCDAASHQWLHYRDIVYIRQPLECTKDVEERFNEKRT
jgi:hypothetical protein